MAYLTSAYAVFCSVEVPHNVVNEILELPTDLAEYLRTGWVVVEDLDEGSLALVTEPVPIGRTIKSKVTIDDFEKLATSLSGLTKKGLEADILDPLHFKSGERIVATRIFGILDERSLKDNTMLVVKYDSDFERDAQGNATSDDDTDAWRWYQFRIPRGNALQYFVGIEGMQALDLEEDPTGLDDNGVLTFSIP